MEGQPCAKSLTLSRNENLNGETPKENVFHMHWLADHGRMQMQLGIIQKEQAQAIRHLGLALDVLELVLAEGAGGIEYDLAWNSE